MVGHGAWEQAKCPKQGGGVNPGNGKRNQQRQASMKGRGRQPKGAGKAWGRGGKGE